MHVMTREEASAFLAAGPRTGVLATVRADGRPHAVPVWYDLDGQEIVFTAWHTTAKVADIRRDGRVTLCVDDKAPPFSFVSVEGVATIADDMDELRRWATRIGGRYMGQDRAEAYGARNAVPGELVLRIRPTKVIGRADVAG